MRGLRATAVALACGYVVLFLIIAGLRLRHPFELEWLEGATLEHVRRVAAGAPLYVPPTLDFVPFAYPPLYYYVSAWTMAVAGEGFEALRAVSLAASAGCLWMIFAIVRREAGAWSGAMAAGLFAATYAIGGAWLDIGRVDALFLFLALASYSFLVRTGARRDHLAAAACALLAFLTKQPIVIALFPLAAYLALRHPRRFAWFGVPVVLGAGVWLAAAHTATDGWYGYYVFTLPRLRMRVSLDWTRTWLFWVEDVIRPLWPLLIVVLASVRRIRLEHLLACLGFLLSSWLARLEGGAWSNALLPAYASMAIIAALGLARVSARSGWILTSLAIVQLAQLAYDPRPLVPRPRDAAAGLRVVAAIAAIPGEVLVLDHTYLGAMAGKRSWAHGWAITDVLWSDYAGRGGALEAEARRRLAGREFAAVVVDAVPHWLTPDIERHYPDAATLLPSADVFWPVTGSRRRPELVRRSRAPSSEAPRAR